MQKPSIHGLAPAPVDERRCHVACILGADEEFDKPKLLKTWSARTPEQAREVLSKNDVAVTNASDKTEQLPKILELHESIKETLSARANAEQFEARLTQARSKADQSDAAVTLAETARQSAMTAAEVARKKAIAQAEAEYNAVVKQHDDRVAQAKKKAAEDAAAVARIHEGGAQDVGKLVADHI